MFAPMSLTTYEEARPYVRAIKARITARTMPPWGSDMPHGVLKNDPRLTDQEVQTIVSWIDGGAPKGNIADMPKMPALAEGWTIGKPDVVIEMPEEYTVPADGTVPYLYFTMPTNFAEDKWIQAMEIRPGNRRVVHHVIAYSQEPGAKVSGEGESARGRRTRTPLEPSADHGGTPRSGAWGIATRSGAPTQRRAETGAVGPCTGSPQTLG